jgi:hypothetical protein
MENAVSASCSFPDVSPSEAYELTTFRSTFHWQLKPLPVRGGLYPLHLLAARLLKSFLIDPRHALWALHAEPDITQDCTQDHVLAMLYFWIQKHGR